MAIRKINQNLGDIATWGDIDFDIKVHQNFVSLKEIVPKINVTVEDIDATVVELNTLQLDVTNKNNSTAANALAASTSKTQAANSATASQNSYILCKAQASNSYTQMYNLVTNLVLPTNATYTYAEIDNKFDTKFESFINFKI